MKIIGIDGLKGMMVTRSKPGMTAIPQAICRAVKGKCILLLK